MSSENAEIYSEICSAGHCSGPLQHCKSQCLFLQYQLQAFHKITFVWHVGNEYSVSLKNKITIFPSELVRRTNLNYFLSIMYSFVTKQIGSMKIPEVSLLYALFPISLHDDLKKKRTHITLFCSV